MVCRDGRPRALLDQRRPIRAYGDRDGDGMVQMSFTLPILPQGAERAAAELANRCPWTRPVVHAKPMGEYTFFVAYGRSHHLVDRATSRSRRATRCSRARRSSGGKSAAPPAGRRRRLHRERRPHGRHRRDPQFQGFRRREGARVLPRARGRQPRRPGVGAAAGRAGPRPRRPTPCSSPRWSPSATPTCSTPARCRRRSGRRTRPDRRPVLIVGGPRFDEEAAGELGVDRVFSRGTTPGEVASFLAHRLAPTKSGAAA